MTNDVKEEGPAVFWRRIPLNDLIIGIAAVALGVAMLVAGFGMPKLNKQGQLGTGLFPVAIGTGFTLLGLGLLITTLIKAARVQASPAVTPVTVGAGDKGDEPEAEVVAVAVAEAIDEASEEGIDEPIEATAESIEATDGSVTMEVAEESKGRLFINGATVIAGVAFYLLLSGTLGYLITMFIVMFVIQKVLGGKWLTSVLVAAGVTVLLWAVFDKLLLVQLPQGILGF